MCICGSVQLLVLGLGREKHGTISGLGFGIRPSSIDPFNTLTCKVTWISISFFCEEVGNREGATENKKDIRRQVEEEALSHSCEF